MGRRRRRAVSRGQWQVGSGGRAFKRPSAAPWTSKHLREGNPVVEADGVEEVGDGVSPRGKGGVGGGRQPGVFVTKRQRVSMRLRCGQPGGRKNRRKPRARHSARLALTRRERWQGPLSRTRMAARRRTGSRRVSTASMNSLAPRRPALPKWANSPSPRRKPHSHDETIAKGSGV